MAILNTDLNIQSDILDSSQQHSIDILIELHIKTFHKMTSRNSNFVETLTVFSLIPILISIKPEN